MGISMRYITKQRHKMACAPIALVNIMKRLDFGNATYNTVLQMRDAGMWSAVEGMDEEEFVAGLHAHDIEHRKIKPTPANVDAVLARKNWVLATCSRGPNEEQHAFLITETGKVLNGKQNYDTLNVGYEIFVA